MTWFMGIDIGSGTSKGVIIKDGKLLAYHLLPSGVNYRTVAQKLRQELLAKADLSPEDVACTIATGYGSGSAPFSSYQIADMRCCAKGIISVFPSVRTVIDVVGISTYCGGELALGSELMKVAEEKGIKKHTVFLLGGDIPS